MAPLNEGTASAVTRMYKGKIDKIERLRAEGHRVYVVEGFLLFVQSYDVGGFRASTNHNLTAMRISQELRYRNSFDDALADLVAFAEKYMLEVFP